MQQSDLLQKAKQLLARRVFDKLHMKTFLGTDGKQYRIHVNRKSGTGVGTRADIRQKLDYEQRTFMLDRLDTRLQGDKQRRQLITQHVAEIRKRIKLASL